VARRLAVLLGLVALLGGAFLAARPALARKDAPVRLAGLPDWRAPGGRLVVRGRAAAAQQVTVRVGGVAQTGVAGPDGRFRVELRVPRRPGVYPLVVQGRRQGSLRVRPLRLAAVGDVNLAVAGGGVWRDVAPLLRRADLAVANLECAVSTRGLAVAGKEYVFRGRPAALRSLARAGIDVISLANNHSLDYGRDAFADTLELAGAAGLAVAGGGRDLDAARRPVVRTKGGLRIALLAYSDVRPLGFDAGAGVAGAAPAFPELIDPDVRAARRRADVVVVYFHWGEELATQPNARQRRLAQVALDAGATVVLGAHPHVLQPRERVGPGRLVAWSLGNFVFAAESAATTATGVLLVDLAADGVRRAGLRPARIVGVRPVLP
jgi:poly-gamma-glutamate synthesis protein (capsule biosynthesis protein)